MSRQEQRKRPAIERLEGRELLSSMPSYKHKLQDQGVPGTIPTYLVFQGTIPAGHGRETTFAGPVELGPTNYRGATSGTISLADGSVGTVSGLELAGGVLLRITLPDGTAYRATGMGVLRQVRGGDPSRPFTLLGRGDLTTWRGPFLSGGWRA